MKNIIIAWRFDEEIVTVDDDEKYNYNSIRLIPIFTPKLRAYEINPNEYKRLKDKIECYKNEELLVFIHSKDTKQFNDEQKKEIIRLTLNRTVEFGTGEGEIYNILNVDTGEFKNLSEDKLISIWEEYLVKQKIIKLKNEVISLLLPLAIDIQGLSEVNESKRKTYLNDIFNAHKKNHDYFKQLLVDFWNMMFEQKFIIDGGKFKRANSGKNEKSLQNILKTSQIEINDYFKSKDDQRIDIGLNQDMKSINADSPFVKFIIKMDEVCSNIGDIDDLFSKYISKLKRNFFFPFWLQEFAKKLDEIKISI